MFSLRWLGSPFLFDIMMICCGSLSSAWHVCSIHYRYVLKYWVLWLLDSILSICSPLSWIPILFDIMMICCGSLSSAWHVCSIHYRYVLNCWVLCQWQCSWKLKETYQCSAITTVNVDFCLLRQPLAILFLKDVSISFSSNSRTRTIALQREVIHIILPSL